MWGAYWPRTAQQAAQDKSLTSPDNRIIALERYAASIERIIKYLEKNYQDEQAYDTCNTLRDAKEGIAQLAARIHDQDKA